MSSAAGVHWCVSDWCGPVLCSVRGCWAMIPYIKGGVAGVSMCVSGWCIRRGSISAKKELGDFSKSE